MSSKGDATRPPRLFALRRWQGTKPEAFFNTLSP
jgi:hypothetical protein